jgi:transposase
MNKARPYYETSYKLEVAKMVVDQGLTQAQVCKDLSISQSALARWVRQYRAEARGESGIGSPLTAEQQRIRALEIEVRQLREDNALLKKASAFFAKHQK